MKKLFLGAALAMGSLAFAQQFGVKGGLNVSSISKEGFSDAKSKAGYYAGVFMNAPIAENFSIQPELIYNNLGAKATSSTTVAGTTLSSSTRTINLDYVTVPVMFQYHVVPQFYMEAGPEFGFLVNAKSKGETTIAGISTSFNNDIKDKMNTFNFGLGLGAGFNVTNNFGINARYVAGFTDLNKDGQTSLTNSDSKNRNNNFQVGISYKF
ncbi:porin family protein [Bergeyella sp. RCAD1439]|uniref:porin family protein n=1 Tax=Bergeyella anatis TaxID=3113737 RepID=UPI002E189135|nr:porin family protein [Bergeyella sp. RCAD1439]